MRIIHLIQKPQSRGAELFASQLSVELVKRGHTVLLVTIFEGGFELPFSGRQIRLNRPIGARFWDVKGWKQFSDLAKEFSPDIIQANAGDTLKFAVFSKLIFGWKSPIVFRNASLVSRYIKNVGIRLFNQFLYTQIDGLLSVSQASAQDFNRLFLLKNKPHTIIPIGISIEEESQMLKQENFPTLVHIGGFTFEKNHSELLHIFQKLSKTFPEIRLFLIGNGPLQDSVRNQIAELELTEKVLIKGQVNSPFAEIPANSIFLLPSKIEGLPAVILEAMFHKVPVVAYGVGGIPEVLKNGETGFCIAPNDQEGFISAVKQLLEMDRETKEQLLSNAYHLVTSEYTLEKIAIQFEDFYSRLIWRGSE